MNDQANKILINLLQNSSDGVNVALGYSKGQIPDDVHQLLVWNFLYSLIAFLFATSAIIFLLWFAMKHAIRREDAERPGLTKTTLIWCEWGCLSDEALLAAALYFILFIPACLVAYDNLDWLQIWLAPKLYIIQHAAQLTS